MLFEDFDLVLSPHYTKAADTKVGPAFSEY